ncbi:MAG TPA: phospholipase D-like domain-containing protein [Ottowia sp.]|jgi:cardiolipin synthase|uniref:phospholipase D-like domain-containing protein n=1 Tax=Ottowia sp. TaxID=1898956 RepID=UPI001B5734F6|nr:phospholipase D-like domain-containing protein [Ottowia sp.]MBP7457926.1 PLDc N-terminal domain-containing protein [Ottowia sp.]HOP89436.1 phospholipase D-like domain-containing protein [Ottowia sp.]HPU09174.1 phospholipase D-like domain-containing protein [Ottowia sp.]HRN07655.1 phospholipase D-like domain-containing protein [Ottowia sp.]
MIRLPALTPLEHVAFMAAGLLTYLVVTRVRRQRRHPYAALAWVMGIAAFPYLGLPLFLVFGTRKVVRPATPRQPAPAGPWAALAPLWATRLLAALGVAGARPQAVVRFESDGEAALAQLQRVIGSARHTLDLCTYVLGDDEVGAAVAAALADRARAGVRVRLLIDSIGSLKSAHSHDAMLKNAGVRTRLFMPALGRPGRGRVNLRNHRKLLIADGEVVWSGGRNLANEYFIGRVGEPPWLDLSFAAEGALAAQAQALFDGDWRIARGARQALRLGYAERFARQQALEQPSDAADYAAAPSTDATFTSLAQWVPSGPDFHEDVLHALLVSAAFHAEQRLLLATPYYVPDEAVQEALVLAAKRGLQITLLLPRRSNHRLADWARGRAVRELVEAGVDVRLLPAMLHAKAVVVDDVLALCGSANLDSRSLFINYEAMAAFYGRAEIDWLADWINAHAAQAEPASAKPPSWLRDIGEGIVATLAFQL